MQRAYIGSHRHKDGSVSLFATCVHCGEGMPRGKGALVTIAAEESLEDALVKAASVAYSTRCKCKEGR